MKKPLLSICIPTYNRAEYIGHALDSVLNQLSEHTSQLIEICISDNASTDNTEDIIGLKKESTTCSIYYNRNQKNLGFDLNVRKIVEMASGKYCWILGSDDMLAPGSIEYFLTRLVANELVADICLFPRKTFFSEGKSEDVTSWLKLEGVRKKYFDFSKPGELEFYFSQALSLGAGFSYISSMIFNRQRWLDIKIPDSVIGSFYVHAFILAKICSVGGCLEYINEPYIYCRLGNDSFASEGRMKRVLIDYSAFKSFANDLDITNSERCGYLFLLRLEHSYYNIFKHMCHPSTFKKRMDFGKHLIEYGYSALSIKLFSVLTTLFFSKMAVVVVRISKIIPSAK